MTGERLLRVAHHALVLCLIVAATIALSAQTVVDPRYVEFTPSADHNATATDGTPLVQSYSLTLYVAGSSTVFTTVNLQKPAPSNNLIRVDFLPLLQTVPTPGVVFEARVTAVGPGGSTPSTVSNGFSFSPTCSPTLTAGSQSVGAGTATGNVGVNVATGCAWTAASNAPSWITLTGATSGNGNGTVPFSVAANSSTSPRSGTITAAGLTFTVNQAAMSCTYSLSPTSQSVAAAGATGSTTVNAAAGCAWTATSNAASWITLTGATSGNGNGSVPFSVSANSTTSPRSGTITAGGQTFTVNQAAMSCTYSLSSTSQTVAAAGGTGSTTVNTAAGCAWTASSNNTGWLTVTSGSSGNGTGTVGFSASSQTATSPRSGTITIGGQTFTVTQTAAACSYSISPTSRSATAAATTGSVAVTAQSGCNWTATSNATSWLTVTSGASGSGNGSVDYSVGANSTTSTRSGTITAGGQTFTVNQAAMSCTYSLSSASQSVAAGGGTGATTINTASGCAWTATSNNSSWLTVTPASGSGTDSVDFLAAANPATSPRSGTITIGGQTFTVTQAAAACSYSISPTSRSVLATATSGTVAVTAQSGCNWTAISNNTSWLTVTSGATGSAGGSVGYSVAANPNTTPRSGSMTIAGQTFGVTQAAAGCTYTLSSASASVPASGGSGSTNLTTSSNCAWTAIVNSGASWLTVTGSSSGTGGGPINFSAATNSTAQARSGTITVGGQTLTITQAAGSCAFAITPASQAMPAAGGSVTVTVTTTAGCAWTADSNSSWISVSGVTAGTGSGTTSFVVAARTSSTSRTGSLTIAGRLLTVTQAGATAPTTPTAPAGLRIVAVSGS